MLVFRYIRYGFSNIIKKLQNPYKNLNKTQILNEYYKNRKPQSLNILILIGHAMIKHKMIEVKDLANFSCKIVQQYLDKNLEHVQQPMLGSLLCLYQQNPPTIVLNAYINSYNHILKSLKQHLLIFEYLSKIKKLNETEYVAFEIANQRVKMAKLSKSYNFSELVHLARIFPDFYHPQQQFIGQVQRFIKYNHELVQQDWIVLHYLLAVILKQENVVQKIGLKLPVINIQDSSKQICLKLQILKHYNFNTDILKQINYQGWSFAHLIWVSQFVQKFDNQTYFKIHKAFLKSKLQKISLIQTYIANQSIEYTQSIDEWLSKQDLSDQKSQDICNLLTKLNSSYKKFHKRVCQQCMGKYEWQQLNIVYYYGLLWNTNDPNLQFIRRYILIGYASFGVSRKDIKTSTYFYKILQIVSVQKFYANINAND